MNIVPRHQLGYVLPVYVAETMFYQFHWVFPPDVMFLGYPLGLDSFTKDGAERAIGHFWEAHEFLVDRGAERIVQGGIPISAALGHARIIELLDEASRRSDIPTTADFEEVIEAFSTLGASRIAVAAKWSDELMGGVRDYLEDAGLICEGLTSEAHSAQEVVALRPEDGIEMAIRLGRAAFHAHPQADALLLAGGAWLSLQAVPTLEAEFQKPVVTNPSATFWAALRQFGLRSPVRGWGMLIDGLW